MKATPPCDHNYTYLGLLWWNDHQQRPGSGATTIRYVNAFFCTRCLNRQFDRVDHTHSSYEKVLPGAIPLSSQHIKAAEHAP